MKLSIAVIAVAVVALFTSASPAHAQSRTSVGVYVGDDGFSVSVGHGHRDHGYRGGYRHRGGHRHPGAGCGYRGCGGPVVVVPRGPVYDHGYGYDYPQPIRVTVRDVVWDGYGYVPVRRTVLAQWDYRYNAYVWRDSRGRLHVL